MRIYIKHFQTSGRYELEVYDKDGCSRTKLPSVVGWLATVILCSLPLESVTYFNAHTVHTFEVGK